MSRQQIIVTADDFQRLTQLLSSHFARIVTDVRQIDKFQAELNRALIVSPDDVLVDVVMMGSSVTLLDLDTHETETFALVYPDRADIANRQLSVLAPMGMAILGYKVGGVLQSPIPGDRRRLKVERVTYQV